MAGRGKICCSHRASVGLGKMGMGWLLALGAAWAWGQEVLLWQDSCEALHQDYEVLEGALELVPDMSIKRSGLASLRLTGEGLLRLTPPLEVPGGKAVECRLFLRGASKASLGWAQLLPEGQGYRPLGEVPLGRGGAGGWIRPALQLDRRQTEETIRAVVWLRKEEAEEPLWVEDVEVVRLTEGRADGPFLLRGWVRPEDLRLTAEAGRWEVHMARLFLRAEEAGEGALPVEIRIGFGPAEVSPLTPPRPTLSPLEPGEREARASPPSAALGGPAAIEAAGVAVPPFEKRAMALEFFNADFEEDADASGIPDGWGPAPWVEPESILLAQDTQTAWSGKASLRLAGVGNAAPAKPLPLPPKGTVRVRAWVRQQPGRWPSAIGIAQYDARGMFLTASLVVAEFRGATDWREMSVELPPPLRHPRASFFDVRLFPNRDPQGENLLWVDAVRVEVEDG